MKPLATQRFWLSVPLICGATLIAPLLSHGQSAGVKAGATSRSKAGTNTTPKEFTLRGDSLTLNLDRQGTAFTISAYSGGTASEDVTARQQVLIFPAAFGVKDGCNGWFSKEAIFILDQSWTIKVPWAADCPLPPKAKYLPIWALESIANANSVAMKLDGKTFTITAKQLAAFKNFVGSKCLPDATWRESHEPYAISPSVNALYFANNMLLGRPADAWDVRVRTWLIPSSAFLREDGLGLKIEAMGNPDPDKENGLNLIKKTWSLSWADVFLSGDLLVCQTNPQCVSIHTSRTRQRADSTQYTTEDDATFGSLFGAPYMPRNTEYSDFNRVVAYLWYQNTFVKRAN